VILEGRVRDNASSHAPTYLRQLFNPLNPAFEKGEMGVALSLALAARRIGALGGAILAEPNVGAGASVAFSFTAHENSAVAADMDPADEIHSRRAHVLVVDDNATNRMVVEALCEMFDCSTESVTDGVEAVEAAREGRFDVILMDIKMPRMDGVTATRQIRAMDGLAGRAPIIALTANADPDEVREYLRAGMYCVVEKPIKPERLLDALDTVLSQIANDVVLPGTDIAAA
jgi:CheY-like chemotaxis protein